jgi:outer membrane protein OmpA-like peptidoglycan-associated protein
MKFKILILAILVAVTLDAKDIKGSSDVAFLKRFKGSEIVAYKKVNYDKFILPLDTLKRVEGKKDNHNNNYFKPKNSKALEGEHIRIVYKMPPNTSVLEAIKNYEDEVARLEGKTLFSCQEDSCGGDIHRASEGGGGDMSLLMFFEHEEDLKTYTKEFSAGSCALMDRIDKLSYFSAKLPKVNAYISVAGYIGQGSWCKETKNQTYIVLDVVINKERKNKMVQVKAKEMREKIKNEGKIALYGIYFDTDKATLKPDSKPTIDEIAKLLKSDKKLKLLIVGHTDNVGTFIYNKGLSKKRAQSVVKELASKYSINADRLHPVGVSYAAPIAPNSTQEGRAKNRRVELVELSK